MAHESDPALWKRVDEVVGGALELAGAERADYLARECGGDAELRAEVDALLERSGRLDGFLGPEQSPMRAHEPVEGSDPWIGRTLDGFVIRERIGSGGMGSVYEAWQAAPGRSAAVKVLRQRFARDEDLRRFEHEAAILAKLGHPSVAHLYASGLAEDPWEAGQQLPYFAMELVRGARTITQYAEDEGLDRRARIELFLEVCGAVHHAHQRGILHRDLKPSNLLVDAEGRPKVIDFGIARAVDGEVTARSLTHAGQLVGTLQYMSPQQVGSQEVDLRCDVYSLGMVLYELLTGKRAYEIGDTTLYEALRIIREEPPDRPSVHDSSLRGDLETILLKSLHKDPDQRFASVHEFSEDLRRFLANEPITARPPTTAYRLRLFARRNPLASLALAAALLFLVGGGITSSALYLRERSALRDSERQTRVTSAINEFLREDLLGALDPTENATPDLRIREVLDRASRKIGTRFPDEPIVEAEVRRTIATTYEQIGLPRDALPHTLAALELFEREGAEYTSTALALRGDLIGLLGALGRFEEAEQALVLLRAGVAAGDGPPGMSWRLPNLEAGLARRSGRPLEALPFAREARRLCSEERGAEHRDTLALGGLQALILMELGRLDESAALHEEVLSVRRERYGEDDPGTLNSVGNLALVRQNQGRYAEARRMLEDTLERGLRVLGPENSHVLTDRRNLALAYLMEGETERAEAEIRTAYHACLALLGADHGLTLACALTLGSVTARLGRLDEAQEILAEAYDGCVRSLGMEHPQTLETALALALAVFDSGDAEGAIAVLEGTLDGVPDPDEGQRERVLALMNVLGRVRMRSGDPEGAVETLAEVARRMQEWSGVHVGTAVSLYNYGSCLRQLQRLDEAETALFDAHAMSTEIFGAKHANTRNIAGELARCYEDQGRDAEADALRAGL